MKYTIKLCVCVCLGKGGEEGEEVAHMQVGQGFDFRWNYLELCILRWKVACFLERKWGKR